MGYVGISYCDMCGKRCENLPGKMTLQNETKDRYQDSGGNWHFSKGMGTIKSWRMCKPCVQKMSGIEVKGDKIKKGIEMLLDYVRIKQNQHLLEALDEMDFMSSEPGSWPSGKDRAGIGIRKESAKFVRNLLNTKIKKIALENPIGCISTRIRPPDQIIQPWQFGHFESKSTCLWLKNLPKLRPTAILKLPSAGRWNNQTKSGQNNLSPSELRWKLRSRTYLGIAKAMAVQWGVE